MRSISRDQLALPFGDDVPSKTCGQCGESKPLTDYYVRDKRTMRPYWRCKKCHNADTLATSKRKYAENPQPFIEASRAYFEANKGHCQQRDRAYKDAHREEINAKARVSQKAFREAHPEVIREKRKRYKAKHRDVIRASGIRYYEKNREALLARGKAWREANAERFQAIAMKAKHKRRAAVAGGGGSHTQAEWLELKAFYDHTCLMCGRAEPEISLTRDHVIPVSKGGSSYIDNIQPLCRHCNNSKHAKVIDLRSRE